jgi:AcrR family transcriptional regulator
MANEDVRIRLLRAAGPVFAAKGYHAATVREICAAAGVNVASVNYHFGDKETLYIETIKLARQLRADRFPLPAWTPDTTAQERLRDFIHTLCMRILAVDEVGWNTRLMLREVIEPSGVCSQLVHDHFRPLFELLVSIIRELLPAGAPDHLCQQTAFSVMGQCLYYRVAEQVIEALTGVEQRREYFQPHQIAEHVTRLSLAAAGVRPPLGQDAEEAVAVTERM